MSQLPEMPATQKKGSINKCPSCGAQLGAFASACESCGHEFTDIDANRSITALVERFEEIEREVDLKGIKGKHRLKAILEKKARVIRDFPVPNSRDDLQQLMFFIQPKIVNSVQPDANIEDWRVKFHEVLNRARYAYKNDAGALAEFERIEKSLDSGVADTLRIKAKRSPLFAALLVGIVVLAGIGFAGSQMTSATLRQCEQTYAAGAQAEQGRLGKIEAAVDQGYQAKRYQEALAGSRKLQWEVADPACKAAPNQQARASWNDKRTQLTEMIQKSIDADAAQTSAAAQRQAADTAAAANRQSAEKQAEAKKQVELAHIAADRETAKDTEKKW